MNIGRPTAGSTSEGAQGSFFSLSKMPECLSCRKSEEEGNGLSKAGTN